MIPGRGIQSWQKGSSAGEEVLLAIRPEKIEVFKLGEPPEHLEPSNLLPGRIDVVTFLGAAVRLVINIRWRRMISDVIEKEFEQRQLRQGEEVFLYFPPEAFTVYPTKEGFSLNRTEPLQSSPASSFLESDRLLTWVAMGFLLAILVFFMLYPVFDICKLSFFKNGLFTLKNYATYFTNPRMFRSFTNSLYVSIVTTLITTVLAFFFAYGLTRTTIRGKGIFYTISTFPLIAPSIIQGLALILLFGRNGLITRYLLHTDWNIYGVHRDHRRRVSLLFSQCPLHPLYHPLCGRHPTGRGGPEPGGFRPEDLL